MSIKLKDLLKELDSRIDIISFLSLNKDDNENSVEGTPVLLVDNFITQTKTKKLPNEIVFSNTKDYELANHDLLQFCQNNQINIRVLPAFEEWSQLNPPAKTIKEYNIGELLKRSEINVSSGNIKREISGKRVLVTGGAGSIGSEIVKLCLQYNASKVTVIDKAESALHQLSLELDAKNRDQAYELMIADLSDSVKTYNILSENNPQIIFHAAAYKHVPIVELNPSEAIKNNLLATDRFARLAIDFEVEKFVMISTDKAVNPTSVMGATKKAAELCVQSLNESQKTTQFITTRFGNVLGSNSSVIHTFHDQIKCGGPVTITHKDITRYFMTIHEACQLVLEAAAMGSGGEIFIFDMGEAVKIQDLAIDMIQRAGLVLNEDIRIEITGLRPGEKLHEELLARDEFAEKTHHDKILKISGTTTLDQNQILNSLHELHRSAPDDIKMVEILKKMIPTFLSTNSPFEALDIDRLNDAK